MLVVEGHDEQWCAACAAVDGSVELRVGEPPRRGLLRRRDPGGEAWLRDRGFFAIRDAWTLPVPASTSEERCAATLAAALEAGLGVDPGAALVHELTYPFVAGDASLPAPDAPLEDHIAAAVRGLALAGTGRTPIESGRPAELRGWVWTIPGERQLHVELELEGAADSPAESWREPLTLDGAAAAAAELARRIRADRPGIDDEPLLINTIGG